MVPSNRQANLPGEFRWFLSDCGGGVVGSEWVDGISLLQAAHEKFKREKSAGGWRSDVLVIDWDGAGNPSASTQRQAR